MFLTETSTRICLGDKKNEPTKTRGGSEKIAVAKQPLTKEQESAFLIPVLANSSLLTAKC